MGIVLLIGIQNAEKQKTCLSILKRTFLNIAPLTGIDLAINWLKINLNHKSGSVKNTKMITYLVHGSIQ